MGFWIWLLSLLIGIPHLNIKKSKSSSMRSNPLTVAKECFADRLIRSYSFLIMLFYLRRRGLMMSLFTVLVLVGANQ